MILCNIDRPPLPSCCCFWRLRDLPRNRVIYWSSRVLAASEEWEWPGMRRLDGDHCLHIVLILWALCFRNGPLSWIELFLDIEPTHDATLYFYSNLHGRRARQFSKSGNRRFAKSTELFEWLGKQSIYQIWKTAFRLCCSHWKIVEKALWCRTALGCALVPWRHDATILRLQ
jgi:hypothetical protein